MTPNTATNLIRTAFVTLIEAENTSILGKVAYENTKFDPPSGSLWVDFHVGLGDRFLAAYGEPRRFRNPGIMYANIYAPLGTGTAESGVISDAIVSEFEAKTINGVVFQVPKSTNLGRQEEYNKTQVVCPFYFDSTSSLQEEELQTVTPTSLLLEVPILQTSPTDVDEWNIEVQLARLTDSSFSSPILTRDTIASQTNWFYRLEGGASSGDLQSVVSPGIEATILDSNPGSYHILTAFYMLTNPELLLLNRGETYWLRKRQATSSSNPTWSEWTVDPVIAH